MCTKQKRQVVRSKNQITHSPELSRKVLTTTPEPPPIHIISLASPPYSVNEFSYKEDNSVLKRLQHTEAINPHQLSATSKSNSKLLSFKSSKSSIFRSFSDRSSDRHTYISALRHRHSLKFETREQFVPSPSQKSTNTSSNSISNLSESDGSLLSSSTTRSQDSPASVPAVPEDGPGESTGAYTGKPAEWWREDEHLLFNEPLVPWSQTAEESLKLDMEKYEIHRQDLIWELIYTERTHVRKLKVMLYVFKQPLLKQPHIVSKLKVENQLFPKLEEITELHSSLLTSLLGRQQSCASSDIKISDILIEWFSNENANSIIQHHTEFSLHSDEAAATFNNWRRGKDLLKHDFILGAEQEELCRRLSISELLSLVWQRMTRYHIFIENIIGTYKEECAELSGLKEALAQCNMTIGGIDDAIHEKLNSEALCRYQEKFDNSQPESSKVSSSFSPQYLSNPGTKLLYHSVLNWKVGKNKSIEVHALLFSDLFVLLEYDENKDKYFLKSHQSHTGKTQEEISPVISLSDLIFRDQAINKASFFVCNLESGQNPKLYEFSTPSRSERDKWEFSINKALRKFAKRNQKLEQNEKEREEHFKQYKERSKKELANRSSSTPQPSTFIPNIRPHVISSISQPLQEMTSQEEIEIVCEITSPISTADNLLANIPESVASFFEDSNSSSSFYSEEQQRLASVFTERIPAYCDPAVYNFNPPTPLAPYNSTQSPVLDLKSPHDEKKPGWLRGFERVRSLSSQGHRDDVGRPRSVSDRDFIINSLSDDSKRCPELSRSLQPVKKSSRISVPFMGNSHPLSKTEMCSITNYDMCMLEVKSNLSSHLNKSESSLAEKPREERKSLSNLFKGFKQRKSSRQLKETDYVSQSLPRRSSHVSLTPNLERRIRQSDPDVLSVSSDSTLTPRLDRSPTHSPLNRTSDRYRRISQDKSVSLESLENLSPFKQQN